MDLPTYDPGSNRWLHSWEWPTDNGHKPFGPWIEELAAFIGAEVSRLDVRTWHLETEYGTVRFSVCDHYALKFHRASVNHVDHKAGEQPACWTMARFEQEGPRSFLSRWYPRLVKFGEHRRSLTASTSAT